MKTDIEKILEAVGKRIFPHTGYTILNGVPYNPSDIPNDLNAIRELELLVIEKFGAERYGDAVTDHVDWEHGKTTFEWYAYLATADAPTRIAAMVAVMEEVECVR